MPQQRKKILIVDNDEDVLIALERVMEETGYNTTTAWDLPEGLDLMTTSGFDLLLIGDHPPELNCERVLKLLRREDVKVPCIVMHTAARHPFSEPYLRFLGASGIACKWSAEEVAAEVARCLAPKPAVAPKFMCAAAGRAG
jgi:DNA-binding response OmpR family regulator